MHQGVKNINRSSLTWPVSPEASTHIPWPRAPSELKLAPLVPGGAQSEVRLSQFCVWSAAWNPGPWLWPGGHWLSVGAIAVAAVFLPLLLQGAVVAQPVFGVSCVSDLPSLGDQSCSWCSVVCLHVILSSQCDCLTIKVDPFLINQHFVHSSQSSCFHNSTSKEVKTTSLYQMQRHQWFCESKTWYFSLTYLAC